MIDRFSKAFRLSIINKNISSIEELEELAKRRIKSFLDKGSVLDIKPIVFFRNIETYPIKVRYCTFFTIYFGLIINEIKKLSAENTNIPFRMVFELAFIKVKLTKGL